ncbi:MAG TPA: cupin domain-containing protein, partial [Vicinamibacteria bacterium]|nr:cupin domain-containing protein [Vicinamibacteria bacterium]
DVMASLAAPLGSVGPHVDSYDVFLLQGRGRRRWRIARRFEATLRPGLDLAVLRRFGAEREWVLEPGDMLYLPPGVAHHGVALEECLTYSIGFRAPAHGDLVAGFLARVVAGLDRSLLYADPGLAPAREPAAIDPAALRHMRRIVSDAVACLEGPEFTRFVGEHLTEPRRETARRRLRVSAEALRRALRGGGWLSRRPGARVAFVRGRRGPVSLYADGREWPVPKAIARAVPLLARRRRLDAGTLRSWRGRPALLALLARLVTDGVFELEGRRARGATRRGRPGSRRARGSPRRGGRR